MLSQLKVERKVLSNPSTVGFSGPVGLETVSSLSAVPVVANCKAVVSNRGILSLPAETVTIHSGQECSGSDGNYFSCAHSEPGVFKLEPINRLCILRLFVWLLIRLL